MLDEHALQELLVGLRATAEIADQIVEVAADVREHARDNHTGRRKEAIIKDPGVLRLAHDADLSTAVAPPRTAYRAAPARVLRVD